MLIKPNPMVRVELGLGDIVITPLKRRAIVVGFSGDRVLLKYLDTHEGVQLSHKVVELVRKAIHREDK